jgi:hypothetical protein
VPGAFDRRRWLAVAVLVVCAELVVLALAIGPYPHEKGSASCSRWCCAARSCS